MWTDTKPDIDAALDNGIHPNDPQLWEPLGQSRLAALTRRIPEGAYFLVRSPEGRPLILQVVEAGDSGKGTAKPEAA